MVYLVTAAVSIIYASQKLRKPGISQEVRTVVFRRHVLSIIFFVVAYAYFFVSVLIDFEKIGNQQLDLDLGYLNVLKVIFIF